VDLLCWGPARASASAFATRQTAPEAGNLSLQDDIYYNDLAVSLQDIQSLLRLPFLTCLQPVLTLGGLPDIMICNNRITSSQHGMGG
jgi:hypothetical protein